MTSIPFVRCTSSTFPPDALSRMASAGVLTVHEGHFLYPADALGMHLTRFFPIEPLSRSPEYVGWIAHDVACWVQSKAIRPDVLFAPAQAGVTALAETIAKALAIPVALWSTLPSGRFCEPTGIATTDFVRGQISSGARVLVFNGVTQQGRCVGQRLQGFSKAYGGVPVGLAVFAKGTTGMVSVVEREWGDQFYATIQVDVPVYAPADCPLEQHVPVPPLVPWTHLH